MASASEFSAQEEQKVLLKQSAQWTDEKNFQAEVCLELSVLIELYAEITKSGNIISEQQNAQTGQNEQAVETEQLDEDGYMNEKVQAEEEMQLEENVPSGDEDVYDEDTHEEDVYGEEDIYLKENDQAGENGQAEEHKQPEEEGQGTNDGQNPESSQQVSDVRYFLTAYISEYFQVEETGLKYDMQAESVKIQNQKGQETEITKLTCEVPVKDAQADTLRLKIPDSMRENEEFPSILIDMIKAGEASGSLENSLTRMAIQFEKDAKLKGVVKKAMMYPIVLIFVMIGVIVVMLTFVIPSFMTMFEDLDSELPVTTRAILAMSDSVKGYWYVYLIVVIGIVVGVKLYGNTENGRHNLDKLKLKIPVFGLLQTKSACASFARTMSTLLQAGMPMIDALEISASTMKNVLYYDALEKVKSGVSLGLPLSNQLRTSGLFPPMVVHMVGIGEETGNVEEMLTNSAVYYEEEVEVQTQTLTSLMEPIIIVLMAFVVVLLILAIYQPMIQLYNTLGSQG